MFKCFDIERRFFGRCLVYLFNIISIPYGLFEAEIWNNLNIIIIILFQVGIYPRLQSQGRCDSRSIFKGFEFRVFPSLRLVAIWRLKSPDYPTLYPWLDCGEEMGLYFSPKNISVKWNVNCFVQDLNSGHQFCIRW